MPLPSTPSANDRGVLDQSVTGSSKEEAFQLAAVDFDLYQYSTISSEFDSKFYAGQFDEAAPLPNDLVAHYLEIGAALGKDPSPSFSTTFYTTTYEDVAQSYMNPFFHFLQHGREEGRQALPPAPRPTMSGLGSTNVGLQQTDKSPLLSHQALHRLIQSGFSLGFYRSANPDLAIAESEGLDLVQHYIDRGVLESRDPHPEFCTAYYVANNPEVAASGIHPFAHYLQIGRAEGRPGKASPAATVASSDPLHGGKRDVWDGYDHVRAFGFSGSEKRTKDLEALDFLIGYRGLTESAVIAQLDEAWYLSTDDKPLVSIVIPCWNQWLYTAECMASVLNAAGTDAKFEIILVNNGSSDTFYRNLPPWPGLTVLHNDSNVGFGPACNQGVNAASGEFVILLNNDAQMKPGCVKSLLKQLQDDQKVGAAVPKVLSFDGGLQEAGCFISQSGDGKFVGLGDDHRRPRYNYSRSLDYGSAVAFAIRTELFRELGGFDDIYAPAYYEDVDLCMRIRASSLLIRYVPEAVIAHHLSKTSSGAQGFENKMRLVVRNKQEFLSRWQRELLANQLRLIAFYLPQYHPIPENDRWWGKGFTEWNNIVKARPNYKGHRQPRRPGGFGYYDLRSIETMEDQAKLAARYGLSGFCYYYYWFDGKRLLDMPLERMLSTGRPNFPFCLCWANENWTRTWDGMNKDILIGQDYSEENDEKVIADISRYFESENYIRVNGKPLILVYRVKEFPLFARTAQTWRNYARTKGVGEIIIASVESFDLSSSPEDPANFGCDISVEFPPHGMVHDPAMSVAERAPGFTGSVHDYRALAGEYMRREEPGWKRLRSVLVGWDNTPRRQNAGLVLEHATPGAFQAWLEWTIARTLEQNYGDERLIFINAWNEWCEGSYLEPDAQFGYSYLQALKNARDSIA